MKVDAGINYYGKPYHTMVTIGSLLEHSGHLIDRIYLIKEAKQTEDGNQILKLLKKHDWNVEIYVPVFYLGWKAIPRIWRALHRALVAYPPYRRALRYQYALERSDKRYVFLTHNDVLFEGDVITPMTEAITTGGHAGVGDLSAGHLSARFAMIDRETYRRETRPRGCAWPFGSRLDGDVGVAWFRDMMHAGRTFAHVSAPYRHVWATERDGSGHDALVSDTLYAREEAVARRYYQEHYAPK